MSLAENVDAVQRRRERFPDERITLELENALRRYADMGAGQRFCRASIDQFAGPLRSRLERYVASLPDLEHALRRQRDSQDWFEAGELVDGWEPGDIGNWPVPPSREALRRSHGLALFGPVGVGKTHAAVAVLRAALKRGHPGRFISAAQLAADLRDSVGHRRESPDEVIAGLARIPLLCIDDLDKISGSPFICEQIFTIIDARYRAELPVIVTSNSGPTGITAAFEKMPASGEAIVDRLRETIPNENWLELRGTSRRIAA